MLWYTLSRRLATVVVLGLATGCADEKPQGQCAAFDKCGGVVDGTWTIGSSCVEGNLTALANLNPVLPVACQGMYKSVSGVMTGTVSFDAGTAAIDTKMTITFEISLDSACARAYELATLDAVNCETLGPQMVPVVVENQPHTTISCALAESRCNCSATDEIITRESRSYTIADSSIHYTGSKYPLDFCVNGSVMRGRQFDGDLISTVFIDATR